MSAVCREVALQQQDFRGRKSCRSATRGASTLRGRKRTLQTQPVCGGRPTPAAHEVVGARAPLPDACHGRRWPQAKRAATVAASAVSTQRTHRVPMSAPSAVHPGDA